MSFLTPLSRRIGWLALSLLLPAVLLGTAMLCLSVLASQGHHDRAIVWVSGAPAQVALLRSRVESHPVFAHGRVAPPVSARYRDPHCPNEGVAIAFEGLRAFEARAALQALRQLAEDTGVRACRTDTVVYNDLPSPFDLARFDDTLVSLALIAAIPAGAVFAVYWAFAGQFGLPGPLGSQRPPRRTLGLGLATGLAAGLVILGADAWAGASQGSLAAASLLGRPEAASLPAVLGIALLVPVLEETVFRAWLIPVAERALGAYGAAALSATVFAAAHLPATLLAAAVHLAVGALLAGLFLRTRSLAACALAHASCNALGIAVFVWG